MELSTIGNIQNKIQKLEKELARLQVCGLKSLEAIEKGAEFGYIDGAEFESYFPCELLEVIDREKFVVKVREISINAITTTDVFALHICE